MIRTGRDLYVFTASLSKRAKSGERTLEQYLAALWQIARPLRHQVSIAPSEFASLLELALDAPVPPAGLIQPSAGPAEAAADFDSWEATILRQLRDLREMAEAGLLDRDDRYLGLDSPRGSRWYNFDPGTYLECAVTGAFGGWEEGDDTGRQYVPGLVAVMNNDGQITSADPRKLEDPAVALESIGWSAFEDFLLAGQLYE